MSERVTKILKRLGDLKFATYEGEFAPFEERLPLVTGVAWDVRTAQLALVAEMGDDDEDGEWRQLLFASAGLRYHLAADGPAALGAPVIIAVVDDFGKRRLRDMAEGLAQRYVLFNRVDLNLVHHRDVDDPERLDDALAPLLPRCRNGLQEEISRADVKRFWTMLRTEVMTLARGLDTRFGNEREPAGKELAERLIAGDDRADELPAPAPLSQISIHDFRSVRQAETSLAPVTVVHGPNGGGKSSLVEAMELLWAGTSLRKPVEVDATEYARHLPRRGGNHFSISGDGRYVDSVTQTARAELARNVLSQESVAALVSQSPEQRYRALLATTGLEVPDLANRAQQLCDDTKSAADAALRAAGLPPLPRRDSVAIRHLQNALASELAKRLPDAHELMGAEEALAAASSGAYAPRTWPSEDHARAALIRADVLINGLLKNQRHEGSVGNALGEARSQVLRLSEARRGVLQPLRRLVELLRQPQAESVTEKRHEEEPPPLPQELAVRWLGHTRGLRDAAARFRHDAEAVSDAHWAELVRAYAERLTDAAAEAPVAELEQFAKGTSQRAPRAIPPPISENVYRAAGFREPPRAPKAIETATAHLIAILEGQVQALDRLAEDLASHPGGRFSEHSDAVLGALCRFELARQMRNASPIQNASEGLVADLLHSRLAPLVRELVASIVRFEWYFEPLLVPQEGRKIVLGGLATLQPDLDARLLLNAAERTALGIAWFLALHLLQPPERRRVLVLDDPTSVFDATNQGGLISTLRAFVRLTRPAQLVVSSHDELVAALLADELAPVDGWPAGSRRIRCQRDSHDCTVMMAGPERRESLSVETEVERLGLGEATVPQ